MDLVQPDQQQIASRADALYNVQLQSIARRADKIFVVLMIFQYLFGIFIAVVVSPLAWSGNVSYIHPHIFYAAVLGGVFTFVPVYFGLTQGDSIYTRHVIAVGQMLMGGLLIHLTGGRIETHFHVFGSLAILAFYRDWRVIVTATVVVALDHF